MSSLTARIHAPARPTVSTVVRPNVAAAARWAALVAALSEAARHPASDPRVPFVGAALLAAALLRTAFPQAGSRRPPVAAFAWATALTSVTIVEAAVAVTAVILTGTWQSPFLLCLLPAVLAAGLEAGAMVSGALAGAIALALFAAQPRTNTSSAISWALELAVVAMLAGYARTLGRSTEAEAERADASADNERRRIARDLHDRLGQRLATLAFELDYLGQAPAAQPGRLSAAAEDVRAMVRDLRETLGDLRAGAEPSDLTTELSRFLHRVEERSGLHCQLEAARPLPVLSRRVSNELFRVAQEAVINAERHADAQAVTVAVRLARGRSRKRPAVALEVIDDGRGVWEPAADGHYGLIGMQERAAAIGARLEINAVPGHGTKVCCEVPT